MGCPRGHHVGEHCPLTLVKLNVVDFRMSYPLEKDKGRSFSMFWAINNCGSLVCGQEALPLAG